MKKVGQTTKLGSFGKHFIISFHFRKKLQPSLLRTILLQIFSMSPGKVLKKVGAGFLVTLIERANERLSIEYNIDVCSSFFVDVPR